MTLGPAYPDGGAGVIPSDFTGEKGAILIVNEAEDALLLQSVPLSAGMLEKAPFSIAGTDLTINDGGIAQIYNSTDADATISRHEVPGAVIDLTPVTNAQAAQVLVRDNAGTIEYFLNTSTKSEEIIEAVYCTVANLNGNYEVDRSINAYAATNFMVNRIEETDRIKRLQNGGGLEVSSPSIGEIIIDSGIVYISIEKRSLASVRALTDGVLIYDGLNNSIDFNGIEDMQYVDSGGNFQTLTTNRYAINWIFRVVSDEVNTREMIMLLGGGDHTLIEAQNELVPTYTDSVDLLDEMAILVGKFIIQKGVGSPISVEQVRDGVLLGTVLNQNTVDYFYAYDTTTQTIVAANTWQDVIWSTNDQLNGWTHTAATAPFTCPADGVYEAVMEGTVQHTGGPDRQGALRGLFDGVEVPGSHTGRDITNTSVVAPIETTFKFVGVEGQDFKMQFAADSTTVSILPGPAPAAVTTETSARINVMRIS